MLRRTAYSMLGVAGASTAALVYTFEKRPLRASDLELHPPNMSFWFERYLGSYDVKSLRRGYLVYKNVCKACHSLRFIKFRMFANVFMTEDEAKEEADEMTMVNEDADETGEMFERPCKITDMIPGPYRNEEEAKFANNGAIPPDLSLITYARHDGCNYLYAILTGYCDPPEGFDLKEGLHYNPYFPGGAIAMAQALYPGAMEYPCGTDASVSQLAKDVTEFLSWCGDIRQDERKEMGIKIMLVFPFLLVGSFYLKKWVWAPLKYQKIKYTPPKPPTRQDLSGPSLKFRKGTPP